MATTWITDWEKISDDQRYIVCPINAKNDDVWLGQPIGINLGCQVKRLMQKCYAALPMPIFLPESHGIKVPVTGDEK